MMNCPKCGAEAKIAPVQGYASGIPWSMHLRAYDVYCKKFGPQKALIDLEGRNCRGGFGTNELDDFIPGWREELSELNNVIAERDRLKALVAELEACIESLADGGIEVEPVHLPCGLRFACGDRDAEGNIIAYMTAVEAVLAFKGSRAEEATK